MSSMSEIGRNGLATMGKFGRMDVDRWIAEGHMGKRVMITAPGGVFEIDITDRCRMFDDQEGWADCLIEPIEEDDGYAVTERLHGPIRVVSK